MKDIFDLAIKDFNSFCNLHNIPSPEFTDDVIKDIVKSYLDCEKLTDAGNVLSDKITECIGDNPAHINWDLPRNEVEKTPEYISWRKHMDIDGFWYSYRREALEKEWVRIHGKVHTDEEAAKIVADKWCDLIFKWHLQDNGALNEEHSFNMCALGTILADKCREGITEDIIKKTHNLFYEYYLHQLRWEQGNDMENINWLVRNLPDNDKKDPFDWTKYGFEIDLYCDYGPGTPLYLILLNGGVPENNINNICPWKTGISIRSVDNMVMYKTYGHCDEL